MRMYLSSGALLDAERNENGGWEINIYCPSKDYYSIEEGRKDKEQILQEAISVLRQKGIIDDGKSKSQKFEDAMRAYHLRLAKGLSKKASVIDPLGFITWPDDNMARISKNPFASFSEMFKNQKQRVFAANEQKKKKRGGKTIAKKPVAKLVYASIIPPAEDFKSQYTWSNDNLSEPGKMYQATNDSDNSFKKKDVNLSDKGQVSKGYSLEDAKNGLKLVYAKYGKEVAEEVEKIYRAETAHFTSTQYQLAGTPGMEVHGSAPYYGWSKKFFEDNPQYKPLGVTEIYENSGFSKKGGNKQVTDKKKKFVVLPSVEAGMMFLANYIQVFNGNYARWYSTVPSNQDIYRSGLKGIKPRFVQQIENEQ